MLGLGWSLFRMRWWCCSDGLNNGPSRGGVALLNSSIHHLPQLGRQWKRGVLDLKREGFAWMVHGLHHAYLHTLRYLMIPQFLELKFPGNGREKFEPREFPSYGNFPWLGKFPCHGKFPYSWGHNFLTRYPNYNLKKPLEKLIKFSFQIFNYLA